jgi:hypothetical protein
MSMSRRLGNLGHMKEARKKPRELTSSWPDAPSSDVVGEVARLFAVNLRSAIDRLRPLARNHLAHPVGRDFPGPNVDCALRARLEDGSLAGASEGGRGRLGIVQRSHGGKTQNHWTRR